MIHVCILYVVYFFQKSRAAFFQETGATAAAATMQDMEE